MYHEALDEINQVKSEYESKLVSANDNFCLVKAENETLKEKVDILFKLGRSYIDNTKAEHNQKKDPHNNSSKPAVNDPDSIEVLDSSDVSLDDLQTWTKHKMRGFKRVDPTSSAASQNLAPKNKVPQTKSPSIKPSTSNSSSNSNEPPRSSSTNYREQTNSERYCHYYVNLGKCNYKERTGEICRFEHKKAPMCSFGINCTRFKCMYAHPRRQENNSFLGNGNRMNNWMNPWSMMSPWMTQPQNQYMNPWNMGQESRANH